MTQIIGRGERAFKAILEGAGYKILPQIRVNKLTGTEYTSERRKKETVDFVIKTDSKDIVVRIQDKRHKTKKMSDIDKNQRIDLEKSGYIVIDIPEEECPHLFKDEVNEESISEIRYYLNSFI